MADSNGTRADIVIQGMILDTQSYKNADVLIDGDLTIGNGGWLDLKDSTLTVQSPYNGSVNIIVANGGKFTALGTKIRSSSSYSYSLQMMGGSNCHLSDTEIRNCGYTCNTEIKCGFWTQSDNLTLDNCTIFFEGAGLISRGSAVLRDSNFYPNLTYLDGKISGIGSLVALGGSKLEIYNCTFNGGIGNNTSPFVDSVVFQDDSSYSLIVQGCLPARIPYRFGGNQSYHLLNLFSTYTSLPTGCTHLPGTGSFPRETGYPPD